MDQQIDMGKIIFERLSTVSFETSLSVITIIAFMSFFHNQKMALRFLKYMVISASFLIVTGASLLSYTTSLNLDNNTKIFQIQLKIEQVKQKNDNLNNKIAILLEDELKEYQKNEQSIKNITQSIDVLKVFLVATIMFLGLHYIIEMAKVYNDWSIKVSFIAVYFFLFLSFHQSTWQIIPLLGIILAVITIIRKKQQTKSELIV